MLFRSNENTFGTATLGDIEDPVSKGSSAPSLFIAYAKASFDIGDTSILGGVSYASGSARIDHLEDEEDPYAFSGDSKLYGVDLLVKNYFDSYSYLSWQSEVLLREMDGYEYTESVAGSKNFDSIAYLNKKQAGLYTKLEYGIDKNWKTAVRYDTIFKNDISNPNTFSPSDLNKYSAMLEYKTSEFAKYRLQYSRNGALYNEDNKKQTINTIILQATFAIGAHGAHSF